MCCEVSTVLARVGGDSSACEHHSEVGLRLAVAWSTKRGSGHAANGNPGTSASAASRRVDGVVLSTRVACGWCWGHGATDAEHVGITEWIWKRGDPPSMNLDGRAASLLVTRPSAAPGQENSSRLGGGNSAGPAQPSTLGGGNSARRVSLGRCFRGNSGAEVRRDEPDGTESAERVHAMAPLGVTPETPFNLSRSIATDDAHGSRRRGVYEQVEEGNPNGMFTGQRSGFGLARGRPARHW